MDVGCRVQGVGSTKSSKQQFDGAERCTTLTAFTTLNIKAMGGGMSREFENAGAGSHVTAGRWALDHPIGTAKRDYEEVHYRRGIHHVFSCVDKASNRRRVSDSMTAEPSIFDGPRWLQPEVMRLAY